MLTIIEEVPEVIYKEIPGFLRYRVGDDGTVWSNWFGCRSKKIGPWKKLKGTPSASGGYPVFNLGRGNQRYAHQLVTLTFIGPKPDGMEIRHLNGNPLDNRLVNLCYGTPQENVDDKKLHGTQQRGESVPVSKLTECNVLEIRQLVGSGQATQADMARKFNITSGAIGLIVKNKTWRHLCSP